MDQYIVWQQGAAIKSLWTMNRQEREFNDLGLALAGPTGVSDGSAVLVPGLLLPNAVRGSSLKALTNVTLVSEETVDNRTAYKLEAQDMRGEALTLWVDKTQMVILKLYRKQKIDPARLPGGKGAPFETETTTTFSPQINEPVPTARLEFLAIIKK